MILEVIQAQQHPWPALSLGAFFFPPLVILAAKQAGIGGVRLKGSR